MRFSWNRDKARRNLAKHGVSFEAAARVFDDPHVVVLEDREDEFGELRYHAIGFSGRYLLLVTFVLHEADENETHHLISARKAVAYEASAYTDQFEKGH